MTLDDATKIARVIERADSGCEVCVRGLCEDLGAIFPEFVWSIDGQHDVLRYLDPADDPDPDDPDGPEMRTFPNVVVTAKP